MKKNELRKILSVVLTLALLLGINGFDSAITALAETVDSAEEQVELIEEVVEAPTEAPTEVPTEAPAEVPTEAPTEASTEVPTEAPSDMQTEVPVEAPTEAPTDMQTEVPSEEPIEAPTEAPSETATIDPNATLEPAESGPVHFDEGYLQILQDTPVYTDVERTQILGSFVEDSIVYAQLAEEADDPKNDVIHIVFDTSDSREANEKLLEGYVSFKSTKLLTEAELEDLEQTLLAEPANRNWNGHIIMCAAVILQLVAPTEAPEDEALLLNSDGWLYEVDENGYAIIRGYTDVGVESLEIPYTLDGHYVTGIGMSAFKANTALSRITIHGNVTDIASDAFDGLGLRIYGYNGTSALQYADDYGFPSKNLFDDTYMTLNSSVIDFSYVQNGGYRLHSATSADFGAAEARLLKPGSLIYLPEVDENGFLGMVGRVVSLQESDERVLVTMESVEFDEALTRVTIPEEKLIPDWSTAEWAEGVVIEEEKIGGSVDASITVPFTYTKEFTKRQSIKIQGALTVSGMAEIDWSVWNGMQKLKFYIEPKLNASVTYTNKLFDNDEGNKLYRKNGDPRSVYLGRVNLFTVSGVLNAKCGFYFRISGEGEVKLAIDIIGYKAGKEYNDRTGKMEDISGVVKPKVTLSGKGSVSAGFVPAAELHVTILGKLCALEVFAGAEAELTWSTEHVECFDLDVNGVLSAEFKFEIEILKKWIKGLTFGASAKIFEFKLDLFELHLEIGKGFVDQCTYDQYLVADFCTFVSQDVKTQSVKHGGKLKEPELDDIPGNKLLGWYTDKNYTTKWDFEKDTLTKDITLYAKWEQGYKTVAFIAANEEAGTSNWVDEYIPGSKISQPNVKVKDWILKGWYLDAAFTDEWDFDKDTVPSNDLVLYASWEYQEGYDPFASSGDKNYTISNGKLYYNGHVYEHIADYKLFSAARADAESKGGYLVTIQSQEELDAVLDYVQADCAQTTLWLGVNSTTDWKYWLTGEKVTYWNGADPQTSSSQFNGIFYRSNGKFDTYDNAKTSHYVIEWGDYVVDPGFSAYQKQNTQDSVHYTSDPVSGTVTVTGYSGGEDIAISGLRDGELVTAIGDYAFKDNSAMKSLTIPNTVESIGTRAFENCTALEEIVIPISVTSIGEYAFYGCTALKKVILPSGIEILPAHIFDGCTSLSEIVNADSLLEIGTYAFNNCSALKTVKLPDNLKAIGRYAFCNCTGLQSLTLNSNLTTIQGYAFSGCTLLGGEITIPSNCTTVNEYAFRNCAQLSKVYLRCNANGIADTAFDGVDAMFYGRESDGIDAWCLKNGKNYTTTTDDTLVKFVSYVNQADNSSAGSKDETLLDDVYLTPGSRITEPEVYREGYILEGWYTDPAFTQRWDFIRDTVDYDDITLYANWIEVDSVFAYQVKGDVAVVTKYTGQQEKVVIPDTLGGYAVGAIAEYAFTNLDTVVSIAIPSSVETIEDNAFNNCEELYTVYFPDGSKFFEVQNGVLYTQNMLRIIYAPEARRLTKFTVPDGVEAICAGAFKGQEWLTSIEIPASVVEIGENAFPIGSSIKMYGPVGECAAKEYATANGLSYNEYQVTFIDGEEVLFYARVQTGELLGEYAELESEVASYGGWYKDSDFTEPWDFDKDTMPAGNLNLYLKWNSNFAVESTETGLTITAYQGSDSAICIPESLDGVAIVGIAENAFVSTEKKPILSVTIPDCVTSIADGAFSGTPKPTIIANKGTAAETYAQSAGMTFEERTYTISFETLGGTEIPAMSFVPGEIPVLPVPVKSNYQFLGWYTSSFYTTVWADADVMPSHDLTLYARWEIVNSQIDSNYSYALLADGTVEIVDYYGSKASLQIPDTLNGYTVTRIGNYAFDGNQDILAVILPDSVTSIGNYAFANTSLKTVIGGNCVTELGENCFQNASSLRQAFLPNGVTEIPEYCFANCNSLTDVTIPEHISVIGDYAFYGCKFLSDLTIPESVIEIGMEAFAGTDHLEAVSLPATLRGINEATFGDAVVSYYASSKIRILNVQQQTKNSVAIEWNEVANADSYTLYRKQAENDSYALQKIVTGTSTQNFSLTPGVTYYYKVAAYQEGEKGKVLLGESNEWSITIARISTPSIESVLANSATTAQMTWTGVANAEGYEVWRAYEQDGEYSLLKTVIGTRTLNSGLIGGRSYYYKIRAFYQDGDVTEYSAFSEPFGFVMPPLYLTAPESFVVRQSSANSVILSWSAVEGADGYNIYRRHGSGTLAKIKSTTDTTTYNYNLSLGETYSYAIQAYSVNNQTTIVGELTSESSVTIASLATPQIKSIIQSASTTALISWSSISAADGYELYRARSASGPYSLMKSVTGIETSNYNLSVGGTYYYKVRAYVLTESGDRVYGGYSEAMPITILSVGKSRIKTVSQVSGTSAKIVWAYLSGAKCYEVWRSVNDSNNYELVRTTSGTSIQDNGLKGGQTYHYKVRALDDSEETIVYGLFSDPMSVALIGTPEIAVLEQVTSSSVQLMWDKVVDVDGYELWRSLDGNSYSKVKNVTTCSTGNYNLSMGATYYYKLRAYREVDGTKMYGNYSAACPIKILGKPGIASLLQNGSDGVKLSWSADAHADGYELWRAVGSNAFTQVKRVSACQTTSFGLQEGEVSYKLRSYAKVGDKTVYGMFGEAMTISILGTPVFVEGMQESTSAAMLSWNAVENADGYKLYRSTKQDTGYSLIKRVNDTSTVNYSLGNQQTYYYKLKAVCTENGEEHESAYSAPIAVHISNLVAPYISTCLAKSSGVELTVKLNGEAEGIELWRAVNGIYEMIAESGNNQIIDATVYPDAEYSYKVRAYNTVDSIRVYSAFSKPSTVCTLSTPEIDGILQSDTYSVFLNWDAVGNADKYEISRANGDGAYVSVGMAEQLYYTDTVSGAGTYSYRVRALQKTSNGYHESAWSAVKTVTVVINSDAAYPESSHNYANNTNQIWTYTKPGAQALKLVFSSASQLENNYDRLYVIDGNGACVSYLTGSIGGTTLVTAGDTVRLYLTTDGSVNAYGFSFESIAETTEEATEPVYTWRILGNAIVVDGSTSINSLFERDVFSHITELRIAEGVTSVAANAYENLATISKLTLPSGITSIGNYAFRNMISLQEVQLPDTLTTLGNGAFYGCTGLHSVVLPDGLDSIANNSFAYCEKLESIEIPKGVTSIRDYAFRNCTSLNAISIPDGVTTIGSGAFKDCAGIESIAFPESITTIGGSAFENCTSVKRIDIPLAFDTASITYSNNSSLGTATGIFNGCTGVEEVTFAEGTTTVHPGLFGGCGLKRIVIPEMVTSIGNYAFAGCSELKEVVFEGDALTKIGYYAFANTAISTIELPESTNSIGDYAFYKCSSLSRIQLPNNVKTVGNYAFNSDAALISVSLPEGLTTIGNCAFAKCTSIESLTLPSTIAAIGKQAFEDCYALKQLTLPSSMGSVSINFTTSSNGIAYGMFNGCANLNQVNFEAGVTGIPAGLFAGSGLKQVVIPESVVSIGRYAFANCKLLNHVEFEGSELETIGDYAFASCRELRSIALPNSITSMGVNVFMNCGITSIEIPAGTTEISNGAFAGFASLEEVVFADNALTTIGSKAFDGCTHLRRIVLPENVSSIGEYAFNGCVALEEVVLSDSLVTLGAYSFNNCTALKTISLPEGIAAIQNYTFAGCSGMENIVIPKSTESIGNYAFKACTSLRTLKLNEGLTTIGSYAFSGCSSLESLTIPSTVTKIDTRAFENNTSLNDIVLPATFGAASTAYASSAGIFYGCNAISSVTLCEGMTGIPSGLFAGAGLKSIVLPNTIETIGAYAFSKCTLLRSVSMQEGLKTIGQYAFNGCTILKRFTLPSTLETIGDYAFAECKDIATLSIPDGITSIGKSAFGYCTALEEIEIPGSVKTIAQYTFRGCTGLTSVAMEEGVETIGSNAFRDCTALKIIKVPSTVTSIGTDAFYGVIATSVGPVGSGADYEFAWSDSIPSYAFYNLRKLTAVTLPDTLTRIGEYAFRYCTALGEIEIPGSVKTIAGNAFNGCTGLTGVAMEEGVETIGSNTFRNCTALKSIKMPATVTSIGTDAFYGVIATSVGPVGSEADYEFAWSDSIPNYAFYNLRKLTAVTLPDTLTSIGSYAFDYASALETITIPDGVASLGDYAFRNCTALKEIYIPGSVVSIGNSAFRFCSALENVYYSGTEDQYAALIQKVGSYNDPFLNAAVTYI